MAQKKPIELKERVKEAVKRYEGVGTRGPVIITVDEKRCKACQICVKYCPGSVLTMRLDTVVVSNIEGCNKCMRCELMCPDFAIYIDEGGE